MRNLKKPIGNGSLFYIILRKLLNSYVRKKMISFTKKINLKIMYRNLINLVFLYYEI